jgi:hypothetical protein
MSEYDKRLQDPASVYQTPWDVLEDKELSKPLKLAILKKWEYDELQILVAEEENMGVNENTGALVDDILKAIHELDPNYDARGTTYTKYGGKL